MPAKVRRTATELRELGDPVRAEELDGRLDAARQEASRALRDRADLYADDGRTLRLGGHRFAVNTQPLDLTLVPDGDGLAFAVTGTDHRFPVTDPDFSRTRPYWDRLLPSESPGGLPCRTPRLPPARRTRPGGPRPDRRPGRPGTGRGGGGVRRGLRARRPRPRRHPDPDRPAAPARGRRSAVPRARRTRRRPAVLGARARRTGREATGSGARSPGPCPGHLQARARHHRPAGRTGAGHRRGERGGRRRVPLRGADHRPRRLRPRCRHPHPAGEVPPHGGRSGLRRRPHRPRRPGRAPPARRGVAHRVHDVHRRGHHAR